MDHCRCLDVNKRPNVIFGHVNEAENRSGKIYKDTSLVDSLVAGLRSILDFWAI